MASYGKDKRKIIARLRRMEGQLRGIQRMVEEDKYCVDVLTQLSSVIAAAQKVSLLMMEDHIRGCVREAITSKESRDGDASINELVEVVGRFVRS